MDAAAQIEAKQAMLLDNFERIGRVTPESMLPPLTGPVWGYRTRARLGVKYVRNKGRVLVGFREKRRSLVADLGRCEVLDPESGRFDRYLPAPEDPGALPHHVVPTLAQDRLGRLWVGTRGAGLARLDPGASSFVHYRHAVDDPSSVGSDSIVAVFEDSRGHVWIGNNGIGVIRLDGDEAVDFTRAHGVGKRDSRSGGQTEKAIPGDAPEGSATLHRVFSIGEDRDGHIWFGTVEQGAWRYDGATLRNFTEADGLETAGVMVIYTDRRGDLWLGGEGVYRFDGASFERVH